MKCGAIGDSGNPLLCPLTAFLLLCFPITVSSQCERGDEDNCRWSNDETTGAKWVTETSDGETYIRLEKCRTSQCGVGIISTPWLPPNPSPNKLVLYFKVYGYSSVYLKFEQKKEDENLPKTLFKKNANYGDSFPENWKSATVVVPPTANRYQLMLKAYTPYSEGFVAVKGIRINDPNIIPSTTTSSSTTTTSTTRRPSTSVTTPSTTTTSIEETDIDFPDDDLEDDRNGRSQALEDRRFLSVDDFNFGRTTVVYPELCKY